MNTIKIGCCGFARASQTYCQQFKLVEIQQTFYKPPAVATARKWRKDVPGDFEFTLKAWQEITHPPSSPTYRKANLRIPPEKQGNYGFFKPTREVVEGWQKTRDLAQALQAKVIIFQCPATFTPIPENIQNMTRFFDSIDREGFIFVWEPRGKWKEDNILTLCQQLDLVHCVDPLECKAVYGTPKYFRLHGGRDYRHQYTDEELARLRDLSAGEAYVLFNNITMYTDALRFKQLLEGAQ